jgi:hypothetical protein
MTPRNISDTGEGHPMIGEFGRYQVMRGFSYNTVRRRRGTLRRFAESL